MSATAADGGRKRKRERERERERERRRSASPAPVAAPAGGSKEGAPAAPVTVRELRDALEAVRGGRPGAGAGAGAAAAAAAAISLVERAAPSVRGPGTTRLLAELVPALAGPDLASPSSSPAAWAAARARELLRRPGGEEGGSAASVPELDALLASAGPLDGLAHEREVQDRLLGCLGELEGRMRARGGGGDAGTDELLELIRRRRRAAVPFCGGGADVGADVDADVDADVVCADEGVDPEPEPEPKPEPKPDTLTGLPRDGEGGRRSVSWSRDSEDWRRRILSWSMDPEEWRRRMLSFDGGAGIPDDARRAIEAFPYLGQMMDFITHHEQMGNGAGAAAAAWLGPA